MNAFTRFAQTSQTLSLAAMEEASRQHLREADIEHLLLALALSEQPAGQALRACGVTIDAARDAVAAQHGAQLAGVGIQLPSTEAGEISFHRTGGYEWSPRAMEVFRRAAGKGGDGSTEAVLRALLAEPSGLIAEILTRLHTTPAAILAALGELPTAGPRARAPSDHGRVLGRFTTFAPAEQDRVWELLADPARIPDWEQTIARVEGDTRDPQVGSRWSAQARTTRPDGKPLRVRPAFRRRRVELVTLERPDRVAWRLEYPDAPRSRPLTVEFDLAGASGAGASIPGASVTGASAGTSVTIHMVGEPSRGWRRGVAILLRPAQRFIIWLTLFQIGAALSRAFR